jgi:non-ribosomal peptide synthetase component F
LADEEHLALLTMHHIVSDGWSMGVLVKEVAALYAAFTQGLPSPLPDLPIQYADYALWQREWLAGQRLADQLTYWQQQLGGAPGVSELPGDRARPEVSSYRGARHPVRIEQQLSEEIGKLSRREGATLFMTLLAAFQVLLSHYSAQPDVVTGTDVANRNRAETEGLIGFFVNQLPLRTKIRDAESFRSLLKQVREVALGAYAHQDVPFEKVVEAIRPERHLNHMPLFQVKLILQNTQERELNLPGLTLSPVKTGDVALDFDLLFVLFETPEGLHGWIHYATDLYEAATVSRLFERYLLLLTNIIAQPDVRLGELKESLGAADQQHLTDREEELEQSRLQKFKSVRRRRLG